MAENSAVASLINHRKLPLILAGALVFARLLTLLASTLEGLQGYGDFYYYFQLSGLPGWPFFNYWAEYPPIFPFLISLLNRLSSGQEHVFDYLLFLILTLADAGSVYCFVLIARRLFTEEETLPRAGAYLVALASLAYAWWYFDSLAVLCLMLGLLWILEDRLNRAGLALGLGVAVKLFPGLGLLAAWRRWGWQRLARLVVWAVAPLLLMVGLLLLFSPAYTRVALGFQTQKGSWETVWALLDGNLRTGNLGSIGDRLVASPITTGVQNPAVIPPLASLLVFGALGLWGLSRMVPAEDSRQRDRQAVALLGFAFSLFFLWSPGWSPAWAMFLLPIFLLALPGRQAYLLSAVFLLVNLLEWPVLLSRGMFDMLWVTVLLRTFLFIVMAAAFYTAMTDRRQLSRE